DVVGYVYLGDLSRRDSDRVPRHVARIHQRVTGDCGESVLYSHVGITDLVVPAIRATTTTRMSTLARMVVDVRLVDICVVADLRYVDVLSARVRDVYTVKVAAAHAIPRNERFTETKRAPAIAVAATETKAHAPSWSSEPRDQCGRVIRANI